MGFSRRAVILLAQEDREVLLLIDDAAGRLEANRRHISNTGTLGILRAAALRQLLDLSIALTRLAETNLRVSQSLIDELLNEDSERRRRPDASPLSRGLRAAVAFRRPEGIVGRHR
jgi:predicted nucleic acid-binding protein